MAGMTVIQEHIRTSSGPRFSIYLNEEDRRRELIDYYNEVHCDATDERLPDDAELSEVVEAIEEYEDVSAEESWAPLPKVWLVTIDSEYDTSHSAHLTRRKAIESINDVLEQCFPDRTPLDLNTTDEQAEALLTKAYEELPNDWWFIITEEEIQS